MATDRGVAEVKLAWWRDEMRRLCTGSAAHPVTRYLADMPRANAAAFEPLEHCIEAVGAELSGVPLEHAAELGPHADALYGALLRAASRLADDGDESRLAACTGALASADYLARAVHDYGRESRAGRVPFPVEELLAAGIDNADLAAAGTAPRLETYLAEQRRKAAGGFAAALDALPSARGRRCVIWPYWPPWALKYLSAGRNPSSADFRLADLYNAWNAARRGRGRPLSDQRSLLAIEKDLMTERTSNQKRAVPKDFKAPADLLAGRIIMVTGASSGLGRALAIECARAGATVILSGRNPGKLERVYDEIEKLGAPQPAIAPLDLATATAVDYDGLAQIIGTEFGRPRWAGACGRPARRSHAAGTV